MLDRRRRSELAAALRPAAAVLALAASLPPSAGAAPPRAASAARSGAARPVQPTAGDWEGSGPHGLRLSFELVGRGHRARVRDAVVSLPYACRAPRLPGFSTVYMSRVTYYAPTRYPELLPGGAFTIKRPRDFALVGYDSDIPKYPVVITGRFRSGHAGTAKVPAAPFRCPRGTGWSRSSRFALSRADRRPVSDGSYAGTVTGPEPGLTSTVRATVVAGGRDLVDFAVSYRCSDGSGADFELGPSRTAGEFIAPTGAVESEFTPYGTWSAQFVDSGTLAGTFTNAGTGDCTQGIATSFSTTLQPPGQGAS